MEDLEISASSKMSIPVDMNNSEDLERAYSQENLEPNRPPKLVSQDNSVSVNLNTLDNIN